MDSFCYQHWIMETMWTYARSLWTLKSIRPRLAWFPLDESKGRDCAKWKYLGPLSVCMLCMYRHTWGRSFSVWPVCNPWPTKTSTSVQQVLRSVQTVCLLRFNLPSLTFASLQQCYQSNSPFSWPTCYTCIVGNISCYFTSVPCSALNAGQAHLLV